MSAKHPVIAVTGSSGAGKNVTGNPAGQNPAGSSGAGKNITGNPAGQNPAGSSGAGKNVPGNTPVGTKQSTPHTPTGKPGAKDGQVGAKGPHSSIDSAGGGAKDVATPKARN